MLQNICDFQEIKPSLMVFSDVEKTPSTGYWFAFSPPKFWAFGVVPNPLSLTNPFCDPDIDRKK
ncbi:MAG: hypothetical protein OIF58_00750 [Cohaesibacter sp.]|nr:hypothetical protein [Cohaesibacter sp.]